MRACAGVRVDGSANVRLHQGGGEHLRAAFGLLTAIRESRRASTIQRAENGFDMNPFYLPGLTTKATPTAATAMPRMASAPRCSSNSA
jgi:hypothetical protein